MEASYSTKWVGFGSNGVPPPQKFELSQFRSYTRFKIWNFKSIDKSDQYLNMFWNSFIKKCYALIMAGWWFFIDFYYNVKIWQFLVKSMKNTLTDTAVYRRGLETCPQAKTSKSGHAIFFSFFPPRPSDEYDSAPSRKYSRPFLDVFACIG